jgi:coenzyme F420-0:L-glutamate ligase
VNVTPIKTRIFKEGENLSAFVIEHLRKPTEKSILVISSKIVALSEGRTLVQPLKAKQKVRLIKKESLWAIQSDRAWLTEKDGHVMANAGIDESNAKRKLILLPKDSFKSAETLRKILQRKYGIKNLGVIITDSAIMPLRAGVIGAALGYAGLKGVRDYRGKKDISGRVMKMSRTNVADSLATAGTLLMGEGNERHPLALITDAPVEFVEKIKKNELQIAPKEDLYWPLLKKVRRKK